MMKYLTHWQPNIIGQQFKDYTRLHFETKVINMVMTLDYGYAGPTLTTFKDVMEVLFSERMTGMFKEGKSTKVMGGIINWLYRHTI